MQGHCLLSLLFFYKDMVDRKAGPTRGSGPTRGCGRPPKASKRSSGSPEASVGPLGRQGAADKRQTDVPFRESLGTEFI